MQNLDTSWLNNDWLAKLAERKRIRHAKEQSHKAPPLVVQDKRDADTTRLRMAKAARAVRMSTALDEHPAFARFIKIMADNDKTFRAPIAGVLDVDLVELVIALGLRELPTPVRFMAVEEVHAAVRRANKRDHDDIHDEIPWCLPKGTRFTLCEFKEAIGLV